MISIWHITGNNVAAFLQGQISADVNEQFAAFCYSNRQGKVGAIGWVCQKLDNWYLCLPDDCAQAMFTTWQPYAQFSKIKATESDLHAVFSGRKLLDIQSNTTKINWTEHALKHQIPILTDNSRWQYTPHMLGLESWAVNFNKGCYLGQEIIARTQNLGKVKRKFTCFKVPKNITLKPEYMILDDNEQAVGEIFYLGANCIQAIVQASDQYFIQDFSLELLDA